MLGGGRLTLSTAERLSHSCSHHNKGTLISALLHHISLYLLVRLARPWPPHTLTHLASSPSLTFGSS